MESSKPAGAPSANSNTPKDESAKVGGATRQVQLGLYASALRCLVTYVLIPLVGTASAIAGFLGSVGIGLQILGAVLCSLGAHQLWTLGHHMRYAYAVVAIAVYLITLMTVLGWA
jgi:hypothetical protein